MHSERVAWFWPSPTFSSSLKPATQRPTVSTNHLWKRHTIHLRRVSLLGRFGSVSGRGRFAGTWGTWRDECESSSIWPERDDDSTLVSAVAWVAGFTLVEFPATLIRVEPSVHSSVTYGPQLVLRCLEVGILVFPSQPSPPPFRSLAILVSHFPVIHTTSGFA